MKKIVDMIVVLLVSPMLFAQNPIVQTILDRVALDSLVLSVNKISGQEPVIVHGHKRTIATRQHQTTGNELAFQFLKSEFVRHGYAIDSLQFSITGKNLYAIKHGTLYPDHWWMIGAHYDDLPLTVLAPGADDNASGCAAILEAARLFSQIEFPYTIVFALWDEEEPGLFGSTAHTQKIGRRNETLLGYINLDMIAWDGNNDRIADIHTQPIKHSQIMTQKALFCNTVYHIGLKLNVVEPGVYNSDQKPFWEKKQSAIAINEHHLFDLNPHMHTQDDKIEYFNMEYFLQMTKLSLATLAELALDTLTDYRTESTHKLEVFPNPFTEKLNIRLNTKNEQIEQIELINYIGQSVMKQDLKDRHMVQPTTVFDFELLGSGMYFLRINTNKNTYIQRVFKMERQE